MNKRIIILGLIAIICALIYRFMPNYFYIQGKINYEQKNYEKAYEYLNKAYISDKNNSDYRYYYVQSMMKLNPSKEIQQDMFKISTDKKFDNAHNNAARQVRKWKNNVMRNIGSNYIEQVPTNKKIMRWSKFPIIYSITNDSGTDVPSYYKSATIEAFSQWQNLTGFLKFAQTSNSEEANILIEIKKLPDNVCQNNVCKFVLGFTTPNYSGNHLKKMNIVIYDKNPYGKFFSEKQLFNTILHEIGHALGIMGHSYNDNDIMYMESDQENIFTEDRSYFQYLSENDINTITLLYRLIPDITNSENINTDNLVYAPIVLGTEEDISNRKLIEAKNYIKNAPDLPGGYIDLGIAYSELGKTNDAIDAMNKAYTLTKIDNEKYLVLYNMSVIYLNSGDIINAKECAQKAQKISDTQEIREIISHLEN